MHWLIVLFFALACVCDARRLHLSTGNDQSSRLARKSDGEALQTEGDQAFAGVVVHLTRPGSGQRVTLIGTSHLSSSSIAQVALEIRGAQPDIIMVELDRARLAAINLTDADFAVPYHTSEGITPPLEADDLAEAERAAAGKGWWWRPGRAALVRIFACVIRRVLGAQYKRAGTRMGVQPGGEFIEAIHVANELGVPCVLGDRDLVDTSERLAELVLRSGLLKVYRQLQAISGDEDLEEIESNPEVRERFFEHCREKLPALHRALIGERDYIMAESIQYELDGPQQAAHVCAIVGAGHLPGIQRNLEAMWQQ